MSQLDGAFQELTRRLRAGRIVGIVQNQHLDAIPGLPRHRIQIGKESALGKRWQQNLLSAAHQCHAMVRRIIRIRVCNGVSLRHQHRKQRRQSIDCALHRKQLRPPIQVDVVRIAIPMLGRLQKTRFAVERRIPRVRGVIDGLLGDVTDEIRRKGVRIAFRQIDHVGAARDGGSDLAVHVGEDIRRNRLRDRSERDRGNV